MGYEKERYKRAYAKKKNKFALPGEPYLYVKLSCRKGTRMHKGVANEVANEVDGLGRSGGTQYDMRQKMWGIIRNESPISGYVR